MTQTLTQLPLFTAMGQTIQMLPMPGYLQCDNPSVDGWMAITDIMSETSIDFTGYCEYGGYECFAWCEHNLDAKRADESYDRLVKHFRNGGKLNQPVQWQGDGLGNGHHRVVAAMDAGFTHVPYSYEWGEEYDYSNTK